MVSWSADGRAFTIHNQDEFMDIIVPIFFQQTQFRSFVGPFIFPYHIACYLESILMPSTHSNDDTDPSAQSMGLYSID